MEYTFLFKDNKNNLDRDCVNYIELKALKSKPTSIDNHYNRHGACFSMTLKPEYEHDDVTTVLTKDEFDAVCSGIFEESMMKRISQKLESEENQELFERVQQEEIEYLYEEYGIDEDDAKELFDYSPYGYKDRGLVSAVYRDAEETAREYCWSTGTVDDDSFIGNYIDYEKMGQDFLSEEQYFELSDGRVVYLSL